MPIYINHRKRRNNDTTKLLTKLCQIRYRPPDRRCLRRFGRAYTHSLLELEITVRLARDLLRDRHFNIHPALDFCATQGTNRVIRAISEGAVNSGKKAIIVC